MDFQAFDIEGNLMCDSPQGDDRPTAGQSVPIYTIVLARRPLIEGLATIIEPLDAAHDLYRIRFAGERVCRNRVVHSGGFWQANPERLLEQLMVDWRMSITPELQADPFPDALRERNR
jgi:hypothetical protein